MPSGGGPPAAMAAAMNRRMIEATKLAYSLTRWTTRPRSPVLPPDSRQTYSPSSSDGSAADPARCCSTSSRVSRRSVVARLKSAIICALVMTGSRGRSVSSNRLGSMPRRRSAWKGEHSMARASSARSRSRWKVASCPALQPRRST